MWIIDHTMLFAPAWTCCIIPWGSDLRRRLLPWNPFLPLVRFGRVTAAAEQLQRPLTLYIQYKSVYISIQFTWHTMKLIKPQQARLGPLCCEGFGYLFLVNWPPVVFHCSSQLVSNLWSVVLRCLLGSSNYSAQTQRAAHTSRSCDEVEISGMCQSWWWTLLPLHPRFQSGYKPCPRFCLPGFDWWFWDWCRSRLYKTSKSTVCTDQKKGNLTQVNFTTTITEKDSRLLEIAEEIHCTLTKPPQDTKFITSRNCKNSHSKP